MRRRPVLPLRHTRQAHGFDMVGEIGPGHLGATVGFREVQPLTAAGQLFTILPILLGVGTALYTFGVVLEALIEGHLRQRYGRWQMDRQISQMSGHTIVCGWGQVGSASVEYLNSIGRSIVIVDRDPARLLGVAHPTVLGDVTDDNVYVTLSCRALRPDLVIIARARTEGSKSKLLRAGADRVVNPQRIGGRRMAVFALQQHVSEFLDVVMHDETLDSRIEEIEITSTSPLVGRTLEQARLSTVTGVLLLGCRSATGQFVANPLPPPAVPGTAHDPHRSGDVDPA